MPDRQRFAATFYVLTTGIQWKARPRGLGAASTVHDRFHQWTRAAVFEAPRSSRRSGARDGWGTGRLAVDASVGLDWTWQAIDGCMTNAPLGDGATGLNAVRSALSASGSATHLLGRAQAKAALRRRPRSRSQGTARVGGSPRRRTRGRVSSAAGAAGEDRALPVAMLHVACR